MEGGQQKIEDDRILGKKSFLWLGKMWNIHKDFLNAAKFLQFFFLR